MNPLQVNLKNEGVVKIRNINEAEDPAVVEYELKTFVCEGEYHEGLKKMLQTYLTYVQDSKTDIPAFWVSGFYGSGKSHLVKMASYLWDDHEFSNGKTARTIKQLPQDIQDLFVEIDRKQKIHGKLSIAGTLRDFPSKDIRYSFLQIFLNALGLPQQLHHFNFVHWAQKEGIYDALKESVEAKDKSFIKEVENLFVSSVLAKSVLELMPGIAENEMKLRELFKAQFTRVDTINRDEFVSTIREKALPMFFGDKIPCTIIILDEIQQFIGQDSNLAFDVQLLAEDLCSRFDGKFLLVGTGQSALTETPNLQRLMARFRVPVQLSNTDIQTVIRKTILDKKPSAIPNLSSKMESSLGEISRNLEGSVFGYRTDDRATLEADYPILPSTRKFWYKVLLETDTAGTSGQLRNQLRLIDDSLKSIADKDVGCVVPADFLFFQNTTQLIQSGQLSNEVNNLIQERKAQGGDAEIEGRILAATFLLEKVTTGNQDTGLKADVQTISDLLIENLNVNSDAYRSKVKALVQKMSVEDKVLMPVQDEFRLQTKVGAEWEQEFKKQYIKLNNSGDDKIQDSRRQGLVAYFKDKTRGINVTQGAAKITREFDLWDKDASPNTEVKLNLWLRDGWLENESLVLNEMREAGNSVPLAYVFVKKFRDVDLRSEIIKFLAAELTIPAMGVPSTPEAEQAKKSMETRMLQAKSAIQALIEQICSEASVYLAGGTLVQSGNLRENIQEALSSIAVRQFPEFSKADSPSWGQSLTKAQAGDPNSLNSTGYSGDVDKHPVAAEILRYLGHVQKSGKDIRNQFMKSPYGWPQDSIDAILIMLCNTQQVSSSEADLKPGKINQAGFKKEQFTPTTKDNMALRGLFQTADINCKSGGELKASGEYLHKLKELATRAGGDAPRPEPVSIDLLNELESKDGNERLLEIVQYKDSLLSSYKDWKQKAAGIGQREPVWNLLYALVNYAPETDEMSSLKQEVNAILDNRLLLQEPDPVQALLNTLHDRLGTLLAAKKQEYISQYDERMQALQANSYFQQRSPEEKHSLLQKNQLLAKPELKALDTHALLLNLQKASLHDWETKIAALPNQFQSALDEAVRLSMPKAVSYQLPRKTITSSAELEEYVQDLKAELENVLKQSGSIILN